PVNSIEQMLAQIEGNYKHVLDTKIIPKKPLTTDDRLAVSQFISTLEMRTPLNKENSDKFISDIREHATHLEEQFMKGKKSSLHIQMDNAEKQNLMFTQMLLTATQMNRYQVTDMIFLSPKFEDEELFFITSDFPVSMIDFSLMNSFYPPTPLDATVEVTIPLTPNIVLLVNHLGLNGYGDIDHNYVWEVNNRTLRRSNKFIISPKKLGDRFTDLNVNRYPQSFVVHYWSEDIRQKRRKRTDSYMKKTIKTIILSIVDSEKDELRKKMQIDNVELFSRTKEDLSWFVRALKLLGKTTEETEAYKNFKLKNPINTRQGKIEFVKVANPDLGATKRGKINFK
ncbi:MAG TPA: DUF4238 domain-containing protein, partial [Candidatus Woesebacteria bacterium]|nr:DUF4238 domain-containing protein [Candidatus Woesebacteria bacterium]